MRHVRVYLVIFLALVLLATGCSAEAAAGPFPESTLDIIETAANLIPELDLPALTIAYDEQGIPSVFGIRTTDFGTFTGVDLSFLELPQPYVDWFVRSNLQHVQVAYTKDGLFLYANGQLLPSIGWNVESLANVANLAAVFGVENTSLIQRLVPILQRLGIDLVLRFPVAPGNAPIDIFQGEAALPAPADVDQPSAVIHLSVEYREDGLPTIMGLTSRDIAALTGVDLSFAELSSTQMTLFKEMNVQNIQLETHADGLRIFLNGQELPRLAYSPEQLDALVSLYAQMYPGSQPSPDFLRDILMLVQQADLDLVVQFP